MTSRRQRILYLNHTGKVSGAEKVLLSILRGIDRTRCEPVVLCPAGGGLNELVAALDVPQFPIPEMRARFTMRPIRLLGYLASTVKTILAIRTLVLKIDPDFIHANTVRSGIAATLATLFTSITVVWHVHDSLPQHPLSVPIRLLALWSSRVQILAVSRATAMAFAGGHASAGKIRVLYNGVDLDNFPHKSLGQPALKRELRLPSDTFLICAVGQICARKGLRKLIEVFATIHPIAPHAHLAIVGKAVFAHEQEYRDELVRMAEALGVATHVHFTGERRDIANVLQSADLMVLNSVDEPFGLVLVEAMSCGTPVLATRVGGIPEIVSDGETGWLVESGDSDALAERLLELTMGGSSAAEDVARRARKEVCPQFSLRSFLSNLHLFYAELPVTSDNPAPRGKQVERGEYV